MAKGIACGSVCWEVLSSPLVSRVTPEWVYHVWFKSTHIVQLNTYSLSQHIHEQSLVLSLLPHIVLRDLTHGATGGS